MKTEYYDLNGSQLCIPVAESYRDCIALIKSDLFRITGKTVSTLHIVKCLLKPLRCNWPIWLRLASYRGILYPVCRFMHALSSKKSQVQIVPSTKIGYGFYTGHNICIVVNPGTVIGNNVNISQFLNIGTNRRTPAIIGDNVYIGPHVCIVEDVKIGNNSTIGAGAVVTRDVPENATAAGVPAKVLNHNDPGRYVNRRFPIPQ